MVLPVMPRGLLGAMLVVVAIEHSEIPQSTGPSELLEARFDDAKDTEGLPRTGMSQDKLPRRNTASPGGPTPGLHRPWLKRTSRFGGDLSCRIPSFFLRGLAASQFPELHATFIANRKDWPDQFTCGHRWQAVEDRVLSYTEASVLQQVALKRFSLHLAGFMIVGRTPGPTSTTESRWNDVFSTKPAFRRTLRRGSTCLGWSLSCATRPWTMWWFLPMPDARFWLHPARSVLLFVMQRQSGPF